MTTTTGGLSEARADVLRRNRAAKAPDGRVMFPGLYDDEKRRERWKWLVEGAGWGGKEFDYTQPDEEYMASSPREVESWRLPSARRRNLEAAFDNQVMRGEELRANPGLFNEGAEPVKEGYRFAEDTTSSPDVETWTNQALAYQRRLWPLVWVFDAVPSLTIGTPTVKLFTIDQVFGSSGESYSVDTRIDNVEDPDYSDTNGECATISKVDWKITGEDVTTRTKKNMSKWSIEAEQDAGAQYGLSINDELNMTRAKLVAREINAIVRDELIAGGTAGPATFDLSDALAAPYNALDARVGYSHIYDDFLDVDKDVFDAMFIRTSWAAMDSATATFLRKLNYYTLQEGDGRGRSRISTTPNLFGTFAGVWDVYEDPFMQANTVLLGARGPSYQETPYLFLNYQDFTSTPPFLDPTDLCYVRASMMRFATVFPKPEGVGVINIVA